MWVQSVAGIGYLFGSISPVIKSAMGYNQRQIAILGVAKDLGDSIGFVAGSLCEILPIWVILFVGVVQNFVGYGLVWLVVAGILPDLPLWVLCVAIFVGTNGETYYNTAALVSCVQNFPRSRGPIVGILKGFAGLSGAILTQIYVMINAPSDAALIFMVAVGPSMVVIALMFIVRPVGGHKQVRPSDGISFTFTYSICLILASYLLGVLLLEDLVGVDQSLVVFFGVFLIFLMLLPVIIPVLLVFFSESRGSAEEKQDLIDHSDKLDAESSSDSEAMLSEIEDEKPPEVDSLPRPERKMRIAQLQAKLVQAAATGAVRVKRRKGPRRGEDFTLLQALVKADFWLMFVSLVLAGGSGLTIIDNMGQIVESLGFTSTSVFVSMISIFNFLGRVGGGYFSEIIVRKYAFPRPVAMAVVQFIMALGLAYYAIGAPGEIYVVTVLVGLGYGAHWAIVPASVSELFGLKSFGALYNFLTNSSPIGSLVFSGVIASGIYDYYADKQGSSSDDGDVSCEGSICYSITCGILSGLCLVAMVLSLVVVHRTRRVYRQLYGVGDSFREQN